ncbi:hypothetical protein [Rhizobium sp. 18065]|uniref:hypothetical protein n=1 Tax=Rhizobium sp. 18065 TaxID=2681411 RepID=UPI001356D39A|nr:hypothetical protein [Rhizobium sp. 18065]
MHLILTAIGVFFILNGHLRAADLEILSTNTLHLGNNSSKIHNYAQNKYDYFLKEIATTIKPDVALFQEVMPSVTVNSVTPLNYAAFLSNHFKGFNAKNSRAYVEAYLFVVEDPNSVICHVTLQNFGPGLSTIPKVMRPPDLLLVNKGSYQLWIANFHAIWGNRVGERISELNTVLDYITNDLITKSPISIDNSCKGIAAPVTSVVLAGDFNLSLKQIEDQTKNRPGWKALQDEYSTLNPKGILSSSYDHFLIFNIDPKRTDVEVVLSCDIINTSSPKCSSYRNNTSDHIGVMLRLK